MAYSSQLIIQYRRFYEQCLQQKCDAYVDRLFDLFDTESDRLSKPGFLQKVQSLINNGTHEVQQAMNNSVLYLLALDNQNFTKSEAHERARETASSAANTSHAPLFKLKTKAPESAKFDGKYKEEEEVIVISDSDDEHVPPRNDKRPLSPNPAAVTKSLKISTVPNQAGKSDVLSRHFSEHFSNQLSFFCTRCMYTSINEGFAIQHAGDKHFPHLRGPEKRAEAIKIVKMNRRAVL